jgi:hypothetical protein
MINMEQLEHIQVWNGQGADQLDFTGWVNLMNNYTDGIENSVARARAAGLETILSSKFNLLSMGTLPSPRLTGQLVTEGMGTDLRILSRERLALFKRRAEQRELLIEDMISSLLPEEETLISSLKVCQSCCYAAVRHDLPI